MKLPAGYGLILFLAGIALTACQTNTQESPSPRLAASPSPATAKLEPPVVSAPDWHQVTSQADWSARARHAGLDFKNRLWVIGGTGVGNDVWSSADGISWVQVADKNGRFPGRASHGAVVFKASTDNAAKIWVIGGQYAARGYFNDVWSSADGKTWTKVSSNTSANNKFSPRASHGAVVFKASTDNAAKIWLIGGAAFDNNKNDVWSSADGVNWTQVSPNDPGGNKFPARAGHGTVVFNDYLWVFGGYDYDGGTYLNDVWSSADGVTWTQLTASAGWLARSNFTGVKFNNKLWVLGGNNSQTLLNDLWSSSNGKDWTQVAAQASWSARKTHSAVVFNDKILLMGGDNNSQTLNDVWAYP